MNNPTIIDSNVKVAKPSVVKVFKSEDIKRLVSMDEAIGLMEEAFSLLSGAGCYVPKRVIMDIPGENLGLFVKPAFVTKFKRLSIKILTQTESVNGSVVPNIMGMVMLINTKTGEILSLCDGEYITALRTGAASGLASKYLARKDSRELAVFGCGAQGLTQIEAVTRVRDIDKIYVYDKFEEAAKKLISRCRPEIASLIEYTTDLGLLKNVDVICTATGSKKALFALKDLKPGVHINAIGSYKPGMQEIDEEVIVNSRVFVDELKSCLVETGDLIKPIEKGIYSQEQIAGEIGQLCLNHINGRESDDQITVFKSVGNAIQDFYISNAVYEKSLFEPGEVIIELADRT